MSTASSANQPEPPRPPAFIVSVAADQLVAHLELLVSPERDSNPLTIEDALQSLADANVTFGIDRARVATALDMAGSPVVVARGRPPRDGEDGRVEYAPGLLAIGGRPHVGTDGKVNLFDLDLVHNVEAGALLASCLPPTSGETGVTVLGQPIPARPGRAAHVRAGVGARLGDDGSQVLAATAGHAMLAGDVITVSPIYHVRGDVGPATGNIEFVGSVSISGNVDSGYRVQAGGDVEIQGSVAAGDVEAAGSVSIRYGIRGHNGHGRVVAGGVVRARFIEFAFARAGGDVYAPDGIVRSTVEAGGKVEVLGHHGSIVGGRIAAREGVSARELGSPHGIATEIVVGADPALVAEAQQVRARATTLVRQLEEVQQRIVHLQDQDRHGGLRPEGRQALGQFHLVYRSLLEQRAQFNPAQQDPARRLQTMHIAVVVVHGVCHPGVRVTIGTATHLVAEARRNIRFERNHQTYQIELLGLTRFD